MQKLNRIIVSLIFTLAVSCLQAQPVFHDTQGNTITPIQFKDKWVVINYWASWCDICLREIPELNNFYRHTKDKNVLMYGVNYDRLPATELSQAMNMAGISYPVFIEDPAKIWGFADADVIPVTYVINPQGKIAKRIVGPTTEMDLNNIIAFNSF